MTSGLETRPGAITLGLDDLVDLAWKGLIRVPHFQRDFKWTKQDVIKLFDSIVRGYPIGSLLFWRRPGSNEEITLGALLINAPAVNNALWVVDGQQRIISLANTLHPESQHDSRFALGYDLRDERIVGLTVTEDPFIIPLHMVFDLAKVLSWFAARPEAAEHQGKAFDLAKHLREFSMPAYQVVQDDVEVLQDIFDRMNNYGKRLSRAEVFSALTAGPESEAGDRLTIDRIAEHIDDRFDFGRIDADTVTLAILARRGPNIQREIRLEFDTTNRRSAPEFPAENRDAAFFEAEKALGHAVAFLMEIGVPHFTLLPYKYLLVVLTRVFAHHPEPDPANLRLLSRWFWRAALIGPEGGSLTETTRTLCGKVHPGDLTRSVSDLLATVDRYISVPDPRRFRTNEAATKIIVCSWWSLEPRDPDTGLQYDQAQLAEALIDRITAADAVRYLVYSRRIPTQKRLWAANRVLLPMLAEPTMTVGKRLLERPQRVEYEQWQAVLRSHFITPEITSFIASGEIEPLLIARQQVIARELESFLQRKCEWGFENTPPLADMVIEDLPEEEGDDDAA